MKLFLQSLKSALFCAIAMALVYFAMSGIANMPYPAVDGVLAARDPDIFGIAVWAWAAVAGGSGAILGMLHTSQKSPTDAHACYIAGIELVFFIWVAFTAVNASMAIFSPLHGAGVMAGLSTAVAAGALFLWQRVQPVAEATESAVAMKQAHLA